MCCAVQISLSSEPFITLMVGSITWWCSAETLCKNSTGPKKLPLQWFPKQLSAYNDWLMRRVQVWPLQLETFWKNHPSIRISCETCHNPYCNCIMIQFIPLLSTASFIPLWAWSLKSLPRVPPAQCLHRKVCLPENATYNRHNEKIWQLRSFDSSPCYF